ncbi:HepT-like ribonuclease domain-containing protein [uncultured Parabacteroides sp.]|uniref:HepT-like ribonuclease domain-containing protein n=1 Tax=uncultured Parabacteroides sp. TaxID=512312 RepID=UPI00261BF3BA|nr:HepT-like ribonuclease domain-containing protein [uncultured Parabacteroides sp.]
MDEYIEMHLNDVLLSIEEVESYFIGQPKLFENFKKDILRQRAIERNVEIMGEAINNLSRSSIW